MPLIEQKDLMAAANAHNYPAARLTSVLMSTLKFNKVNELYDENVKKQNIEFLDSVLNSLGVRFELDETELRKIPGHGPFITISNHPFGGIDGLLLLKIIGEFRSDFKIIGNFMLQRIEPLEDYIFPVNPFDTRKGLLSSVTGLKQAYRHLAAGKPIGLFPAGEVSSIDERILVQDKQWSNTALKFIKNAEVPVIPLYFHGNNSRLFHILGVINPILRTAKLPSELFNKKNKVHTIRIGTPISVKEQNEFKDVAQYGRFLRAKTYALGSALEVKKFYQFRIKKQNKQEHIVHEIPRDVLVNEVETLKENHLLFSCNRYHVFCAGATLMPSIISEIGRLREITFREVGEGTNQQTDLDEFDLYYDHIFIWDREAEKIVGAYRVGKGKEIYEQFGVKGYYINTLFSIKNELAPVLERSLELGRSFIVKEYQRKPLPLMLLWKGILYVLLKNPGYRYLLGPVSISNHFSDFSKSLIIEFIQSHYYHHHYATMVRSRKKFKVNYKKVDHMIMLDSTKGDINKLDKIIEEIEPSHFKIPVLFKKYLKQNARIMGFNVDPRFNKALDGLMILDLFEVPMNTIISLSRELNDQSIIDRIYSENAVEEYAKVPQF